MRGVTSTASNSIVIPLRRPSTDSPFFSLATSGASTSNSQSIAASLCPRRNCALRIAFSFFSSFPASLKLIASPGYEDRGLLLQFNGRHDDPVVAKAHNALAVPALACARFHLSLGLGFVFLSRPIMRLPVSFVETTMTLPDATMLVDGRRGWPFVAVSAQAKIAHWTCLLAGAT